MRKFFTPIIVPVWLYFYAFTCRQCDAFMSRDFHEFHNQWQQPPPAPPNNQWQLAHLQNMPVAGNNNEMLRTRSLNGGTATNGNNITNASVLELMKIGLLGGYAIRRIKMFNDRIYLARYRRSYWFGTRYYNIDNRYFLETRETCAYRMNETERDNIEYEEDGEPILDVIYQCQRYAQYCCGLDCCQHMNKRWTRPESGIPYYYADDNTNHNNNHNNNNNKKNSQPAVRTQSLPYWILLILAAFLPYIIFIRIAYFQ